MSQSSTIVVLPLLVAIMTFIAIFHVRERAYSPKSHNFISAVAAMICLVSYLLLRVMNAMSFTVTVVYAAMAAAFLIWALVCTRI